MLCSEKARRSMPTFFGIISLLLLVVTASCSSRISNSSSSASATTKKIYVSPVDSQGTPADGYSIKKILNHGYCEGGSRRSAKHTDVRRAEYTILAGL
jgi:hypothetical protein